MVREYQRVVLFRLGRSSGQRGPGFTLINPVTDRVSWVDLREQYLEIPHQTAITRDNASINIDFIVFYKVFDAVTSVLEVRDFQGAALNVAATTLRSVVGDMNLDDVLSKREDINGLLRVKLDEVTERWGVKVTNVEVREINPPPTILDAMTRQMSAERTRRGGGDRGRGPEVRPASPWPRARSSRPSSRPRATARPPSSGPRASPSPCPRSERWPKASTPAP